MENVLISACLLGVACRYDGLSKPLPSETIEKLKETYRLVPICPEIMGGLPTPRIPAEISPKGAVLRKDGADVTENYHRGAAEALRLARLFDCRTAILKQRSPSCGSGKIYDGSFSRTLVDGDGVTAALLREHGIRIVGESELTDVLA